METSIKTNCDDIILNLKFINWLKALKRLNKYNSKENYDIFNFKTCVFLTLNNSFRLI